jgi:WD40 repeat protein
MHLLASSSDDLTVAIFEVQTGAKVKTLCFAEKHSGVDLPITMSCFGACGDLFYTMAAHPRNTYVVQWDIHQDWAPISSHSVHSAPSTCAKLSRDGLYLGIGTEDGFVKILNTRTMELEQDKSSFSSQVNCVCFSVDGRLLAAGSHTLKVVSNQHSEGLFSKLSKLWILSLFVLWFYLYLTG